MEKKIEFKDIVTFIEKAINNNCCIYCSDYDIEVSLNDKNIDFIIQESDSGTKIISFRTSDEGYYEYIHLDEKETLEWKLLVIKCRKYRHEKAINYFNNFFKEESKPTDIYDLDNEDD